MVNKSDAYIKACESILSYLTEDPHILIINPARFAALALLLKSPISDSAFSSLTTQAMEVINILDVIPDAMYKLNPNSMPQYFSEVGATALVREYGEVWVPVNSYDYKLAINGSVLKNTTMKAWQRHLRVLYTRDRNELTNLAIDPDESVRTLAQQKLKALEQPN